MKNTYLPAKVAHQRIAEGYDLWFDKAADCYRVGAARVHNNFALGIMRKQLKETAATQSGEQSADQHPPIAES